MKKFLAIIMSVALLFGAMSVIASAGLIDPECQCEDGCQGCIDNACHLVEKDCECNPPEEEEEEVNGFAAFWINLFDWLEEAFRHIGIEFQEFFQLFSDMIFEQFGWFDEYVNG